MDILSHALTGQVAMVTGGGRGFGREIARALAKEGVGGWSVGLRV